MGDTGSLLGFYYIGIVGISGTGTFFISLPYLSYAVILA